MTAPSRADLYVVQEPRPTADLLDEILAALPGEMVVVAHRARRRLVASTAGVFVLDPEQADGEPVAGRAAAAARTTRQLLAQHLSWVPFIDWFVVCSTDSLDVEHGVVPLDLVATTVLEGHAVSVEVVTVIRRLLRDGALAPEWHDGLPSLTPTPPIG